MARTPRDVKNRLRARRLAMQKIAEPKRRVVLCGLCKSHIVNVPCYSCRSKPTASNPNPYPVLS